MTYLLGSHFPYSLQVTAHVSVQVHLTSVTFSLGAMLRVESEPHVIVFPSTSPFKSTYSVAFTHGLHTKGGGAPTLDLSIRVQESPI